MRYLVTASIFLIIFFFSTNLFFYKALVPYVGFFNAYLIDQLFFLFIFFAVLVYRFIRKQECLRLKEIVLFLLFLILTFISLKGVLMRYFIGDDLFVMLHVLKSPDFLNYHYVMQKDYYYYHFLPFVILYKYFKYQSIVYNIFGLSTLALGMAIFYKLLRYLTNLIKLKYKTLPFLIVLFCLTTPNIIGHFFYIEHGVAIGYIISSMLLSIYFYVIYLNNGNKTSGYFILSYLLMLFLLKTALTRSGFLPPILILLEIFFWRQERKFWISSVTRIVLIILPFLIMAGPFFIHSASSNVLYDIGLTRFLSFGRIYNAVSSFIPFLIPYQFFPIVLYFIRDHFGYTENSSNFIINNMFFVGGIFAMVSYTFLLLGLCLKKVKIKLAAIFWLFGLISILFFTLAGYGENINIKGSVFDNSIVHYASQFTGAGYTLQPLILLLTSLYLTLVIIINKFKYKKIANLLMCFLFLILTTSNFKFSKIVHQDVNVGSIALKTVMENIMKTVPDDSEEKVLYSINGQIQVIRFLGIDGVHWFYKNPPKYLIDKQELIYYLKSKKILSSNFYAIDFEEKNLIFVDKSDEVRKEMSLFLR